LKRREFFEKSKALAFNLPYNLTDTVENTFLHTPGLPGHLNLNEVRLTPDGNKKSRVLLPR